MDFADGLAGEVGTAVLAAGDPADRLLANDLGALLGFLADLDAVRAVDLVVGEDAVLEHEPARPPALAVIDPLVKNPSDPVAHDVVETDLAVLEGSVMEGRAKGGRGQDLRRWARCAVVAAVVAGSGAGGARWPAGAAVVDMVLVRKGVAAAAGGRRGGGRRGRGRRRRGQGWEGMSSCGRGESGGGRGDGRDGDGGGAAEWIHLSMYSMRKELRRTERGGG